MNIKNLKFFSLVGVGVFLLILAGGGVALVVNGFPLFRWPTFVSILLIWIYTFFLVFYRKLDNIKIRLSIGIGAFLFVFAGGCIALSIAGFSIFRWLFLVGMPLIWLYFLFLLFHEIKIAKENLEKGRISIWIGCCLILLVCGSIMLLINGFEIIKRLSYVFLILTCIYIAAVNIVYWSGGFKNK